MPLTARDGGSNSLTDGAKRLGTHKPPVLDGVEVGVAVGATVEVAVSVGVGVGAIVGATVSVGLGPGFGELLLLESHPPRAKPSTKTIKRAARLRPRK